MKTHWDEIWEKTQEYKTSGWNGIIEGWFEEELNKCYRGGSIWHELYYERKAWRGQRDRIHQAMLDYEREQWTTHTSRSPHTGAEQTTKVKKT